MRDVIATVFVPAPPNIAWAVLLVIFASALGKRKRSAWWFLVVILVLGMLESVVLLTESDVRTKEIVTLATSLVFFVILLLARKEFFAIVPRRNVVIAVVTLLVGFAVVIPIGWAMVEALPGSVPRSDAGAYSVNQLLGGLGEADATGIEGRATRPVPFLLGALGTVVYVAFGLALFRTRGNLRRITGQDEVDLRVLLHDHGDRDSLGYFATRRDKSAMWSPSHKSAVTYRVVNGVSLASADPIGDPESWPPAIEEWLEEARHYGWAPAVMGASNGCRGLCARRAGGAESRGRGDHRVLPVHPRRPSHAGRAASGAPLGAGRIHHPGAPSPGHPRRSAGGGGRGRRPLAGHPQRARLLHGPRQARGSAGRPVRADRDLRRRGCAPRPAVLLALGHLGHLAGSDAPGSGR
ncbi:MAG: DUF2156 domain-containing protein [Micrococcales bacterium]|nr:DUF2156 domain-containing protein [Micrococcales bacterium]